jgi:hypothetical protein
MSKNQVKYQLAGFYENFNNTGKIKLKFANAGGFICCYIEDIKFINKYISEEDNKYIEKLAQYKI